MQIWLIIVSLSALCGLLVARYMKHRYAIIVAGGIPWSCVLAAILYSVYFTSYQGGGATMWPVAVLFGGSVAAIIGVAVFVFARMLIWKKSDPQ